MAMDRRIDVAPGISIVHRNRLHGLCGWYWVQGPEPRQVFRTQEEAVDQARAAIDAAREGE